MKAAKTSDQTPVSPLADIGFFIDVDGCEATARAIDFLLEKLPTPDRWCVDFGAGADPHGSTTHRLIEARNYSGVLIEGVPEKAQFLRKLYEKNGRVTVFEKFVGLHPEDRDCLDRILAGTPVPPGFDFLSIDIDGNDYHAWQAIQRYSPKMVMIEFNPTIPPEVDFVQPADGSVNFGNSLAALVRLGKTKSYELAAVMGVNAFFIHRDYYDRFGITDNRIEALWTKRDCITYIFSGYDGRIRLGGCQKLPWHYSLPISESKMQALPSFLQKYTFTRRDRNLFLLLREPSTLVKKILGRVFKK